MSKFVIADEAMQKRLAGLDEPTLICTADGTVLGYFVPTTPLKLTFPPNTTEEEIARRIAANPGRKLKDIFGGSAGP